MLNTIISKSASASASASVPSTGSGRVRLIIEDDDCEEEKETLSSFLSKYKSREYLPSSEFSTLLTHGFPSCIPLHKYSPTHQIIKVTIDDLTKAQLTNWEYNRPPDDIRCEDLARYYYHTSKETADTMLCINFNNIKQSFDVIDGIHRLTALKKLAIANAIGSDPEFAGDISKLLNSYVLLNIRLTAPDEVLIEWFKTLNKSIPVPELYIRDRNAERRRIVEMVANDWQVKYKAHFSSVANPNKPNTNRDMFIQLLDHLCEKFKIFEENKYKLEEKLQKLNVYLLDQIEKNNVKKITKAIRDKCIKNLCGLFVLTNEQIADEI